MADVLLLPFDGADGSTTITDRSPSPKTATLYGNAQLSTAQKKYGTASLLLDGAGDYIEYAGSSDFNFGTGDFTIELWFRNTQTTAYATLFSLAWDSGSHWQVMNGDSSNQLCAWANAISTSAPILTITNAAIHDGAWHHFAWVRNGNVHTLYFDGVSHATGTNATAIGNSSGALCIGRDATYGPRYYSGYIDDLRITKGVARYTADFTPPGQLVTPEGTTTAAPPFGYATALLPGRAEITSLLYAGFKYGDTSTTWSLSCDDEAGFAWAKEDKGSHFFDPNSALFLPYGIANSGITSKFGATSIFFPAGTALTLPSGAGNVPAYTNFTLEFWLNLATVVADTGFLLGSGLALYATTNALRTGIGDSPTFALATWVHVAICRKANIIRYYLGGNKFAEAVSTGAVSLTGFGSNVARGTFYLDSIGFSNNYAHYDSSDFVPSLTPFYNPPSSRGVMCQLAYSFSPGEALGSRITPAEADGQWGKTVLLITGSGPIGSKAVADAKGRRVFNQSDVVYSDAQHNYHDTSIYFNGSSAKLVLWPARNLDFIDGDFTIEFWIHPTRIQASSILNKWGGTRRSYAIWMTATGAVRFGFYDSATNSDTFIDGPYPLTVNAWAFVSVCRYGNDYRVCVNGTGGDIVTTNKTPNRDGDRMYNNGEFRSWDIGIIVGASAEDGAQPGEYFQGYLEDFRVTNGFARYTNSGLYVPPTTAFLPSGSGADGDPFWSDVVLLCHFDEPHGTIYNIRDAKGHALVTAPGSYVSSSGLYGGALYNGSAGGFGVRAGYGAEFDLSSGDFTIEMWVSGKNNTYVIAGNNYQQGNKGWVLEHVPYENPSTSRNSGILQWRQWNSSAIQDVAIGTLYPFWGEGQRWHHIAVVRKGNDITLYVDGVGATTTITRRPAYSEADVHLGGYPDGNCGFFYAEEIRITRTARYSGATLKVPTGKFAETAFSYGAAVLASYYSLVPGQVKSASTVSGATLPFSHVVIPPSIIGKPSVEGPTTGYALAVLSAVAKGGEGIPEATAFNDSISTTHAHRHAQVFYVNDEAIAQGTKGVSVRLGVTDVAAAVLNSFKVTEMLALADSLPGVTNATYPLTEAITVTSAMRTVWGVLLRSTVAVVDDAKLLMHQKLLDTIGLITTTSVTRHARSLITEELSASGTAYPALHMVAADGTGFYGTAKAMAAFSIAVTDTTAFHDAPALEVLLSVTVSEDVSLTDIPAQTLLFQAIIQDDMLLRAFFASPAYTTWAMNTHNVAVTQYSNFNFNSFARMGERYLGANDQGLYWLDGDDDDGRSVKARITTGVIQPNGNKLSGVQYAYLGMRGNGQFIVTVTDEAGGSYNYTLTGNSMETARVAFGRGFKTRYFTFALESQGQDFDMDSVEFITTEIPRKVQR